MVLATLLQGVETPLLKFTSKMTQPTPILRSSLNKERCRNFIAFRNYPCKCLSNLMTRPPLRPPDQSNLPAEWPLARISVWMRHVSVLLRVTLYQRLAELSLRGVAPGQWLPSWHPCLPS